MNHPKLAFVGFGKHAQANLYPAIKQLGYQIAAVATQHEESAQKAAAEYHIPATYTDHLRMLQQEKPDAVFVVAKYNQQYSIVKDALESGAHVFVEKPLGVSLVEAQQIADLATSSNKQVMVGFMKRFAPAYLKAKQLVESADFGQPLAITEFFACRNFATNNLEYMLLAASHYIDLLRFYYGEVESTTGASVVKDGALMQSFSLQFKNGAIGSLQFAGAPAWERGAQQITLTGTNGYITISGIDSVSALIKESHSSVPGWQTVNCQEKNFNSMLTTSGGGMQSIYLNGYVDEIKHFVEAISNNTEIQNSAAENVKTMQLIERLQIALA